MATLTVTDQAAPGLEVGALVVGTVPARSAATTAAGRDGGRPPAALAAGHGLDAVSVAFLESALRDLAVKGSADEVVRLAGVPGVTAAVVALVGLGRAAGPEASGAAYGTERLRRAGGAATRALAGTTSVGFALGGLGPAQLGALGEGALLGAYAFTRHRGTSDGPAPVQEVVVRSGAARDKQVRAAAEHARVVARAQALARDLVNTAPNELYPDSFAALVRERSRAVGVDVDVMDERAMAEARCGGTLCVGQGSDHPPRIVTLTYAPRRARRHLALVGKGITFDSGGLWIKPGASMVTMKSDMAGAAAVAAAVFAAAELRLPVRVTAYLCLAENMLSGRAMRPGDVITSRGGRTVEIINPDAEGRLVLLDGLELASELRPDAIVDIATLTGMQVVALGRRTAGLMGNDEALQTRVADAAAAVDEPLWRMPIPEEARATLDSAVADIKHHGEREAGMQIAARFLQEFVGDGADGPIPWAHLDIAGPSFNDKGPYGFTPKGGTGYGVRTLVRLTESFA